jgi:hypothetical protein
VFGINTKKFGEISKEVAIPPLLKLVNPMYLGILSVGSSTIVIELTVTVAIPKPSVTIPVTVTPGPTKFNWVIDPIPAFPPIIFPSSLTVIPSSNSPGGTATQYLSSTPVIPTNMYWGPIGRSPLVPALPKFGSA